MLILQFFIRERLIVCNLDERVRSVPVGKAAFCESIDRKLDDLAFFRLLESGSSVFLTSSTLLKPMSDNSAITAL